MNKALPDDEAIEAKMVTKAIERAQTTVETRNAEIRKNVLKYDEVMNEQRKVIYARRDQILEGADLKSAAMEYLAEAVDALLETYCASPADDEWDLDGLAKELKTFWPTELTEDRLAGLPQHRRDVRPRDGRRHGPLRASRGGARRRQVMREVERQVMLRIIDQRWREHLEEMDYLKEGINLRAMGQKDPLTEWQREGYEMFGAMMKGIAQDFVRYVMHVQVVQQASAAGAATGVRQRARQVRRCLQTPAPASATDRPRGPALGTDGAASCQSAVADTALARRPSGRGAAARRPDAEPGSPASAPATAGGAGAQRPASRRPSSRTSGRRRRATRRARAGRARSSRCATAPA